MMVVRSLRDVHIKVLIGSLGDRERRQQDDCDCSPHGPVLHRSLLRWVRFLGLVLTKTAHTLLPGGRGVNDESWNAEAARGRALVFHVEHDRNGKPLIHWNLQLYRI